MKRIFFALFLFFLTLSHSKDVLLLHSYHKGYIWSDEISNAIENNFKEYQNINLTTIYMDTKRVVSDDYFQKLSSLYEIQFKNRKYDLIIASDNYAIDFVQKYHTELFNNTPVLFCGYNDFNKKRYLNSEFSNYSSGVVEQVDVMKNFELIHNLHPKLEKLLIITDSSKTAMAVKDDIELAIDKFKDIIPQIEYTDKLDIQNLKEKVKQLPTNSAILFVLLFKDKTGKFFTYKESLNHIKSVANVPIYALWDFYINYGAVGGLMTSATGQGNAVSKMALDILNEDANVSQIPILEKSPNKYIFDYEELDKYDIEIKHKVRNYELVNEPFSFYKEYRELVNATLLVFIIFIILIVLMRRNIKRRKIVERNLQNRLEFDKVLLDTIPNPIYYKNVDGKFLGFNKAFSELVGATEKDIIGKTALDFFPRDIALKNIIIDRHILKTRGTNTSDMTLNFKNSAMKHIILNKAVYDNIDGTVGGIVCVMDDITERVQQKQFLIQQAKLAEMGEMVAAIAHQWNEPLVELSAQVQDIQTSFQLKELSENQVKEFVKDSMVQIQYMSKTLTDFRNFLKPSTKKSHFSINLAFEEIFEIVKKQIFYSNIELTYNIEDENITIFGYKNEFLQVLLNIINNAKNKIIENIDKLNYKPNIIINVYKTKKNNIIEIIDDAGSIDEDIIEHIFNPYFTTKSSGTGFGLYMAKVIVEDKMSGKISVSNDGNRVVFKIKIPLNLEE